MKRNFKQIIAGSIMFAAAINTSFGQGRILSLKEAYTIASKANRQLLISKIEELKGEAVVSEARSYLSPNVAAAGNYSFYTEKPVIFLRNESSAKVVQDTKVGGRNNFSAAIVGTYPIINPVVKSKIRTAAISERLQTKKTEDVESEIALEIGQQYLNVLLYKEQLV